MLIGGNECNGTIFGTREMEASRVLCKKLV